MSMEMQADAETVQRRLAWQAALTDPYREALLAAGEALPERSRECAEPLRGAPAFDPAQIARLADAMALPAAADTLHPALQRAVRVGLAHIETTFQGDHPKYGDGPYAQEIHDGFPPTIIAAVDALTLWEQIPRAEALFSYWLNRFVRDDGAIDYYAPSISEYGQLLTTARRLMERGGSADFLYTHAGRLMCIVRFLRNQMRRNAQIEMVLGVPEADEGDQAATYFHNSAWVVRGLEDWAALQAGCPGNDAVAEDVRRDAARLRNILLESIEAVWPRDPQDWWLRPMAEPERDGYWSRPRGRVTANRLGSYTNYRYWPELLSSGVLPTAWMERIVAARLNAGGQFCGMTRFEGHLDDWPLMEHLDGLWQLGRRDDYRLCMWGHLCYHQAEGHLTAYEQVSFPPGQSVAAYCLPCQVVAVRAARRLTS